MAVHRAKNMDIPVVAQRQIIIVQIWDTVKATWSRAQTSESLGTCTSSPFGISGNCGVDRDRRGSSGRIRATHPGSSRHLSCSLRQVVVGYVQPAPVVENETPTRRQVRDSSASVLTLLQLQVESTVFPTATVRITPKLQSIDKVADIFVVTQRQMR